MAQIVLLLWTNKKNYLVQPKDSSSELLSTVTGVWPSSYIFTC